jgi:regulator of replication initiation timing
MLPPETQKRIFLLERENEKLRVENEELKARINRMIAKYKALIEPKPTSKPIDADAFGWLKDTFGMKG